ncbi:MAG: chemotaxis protein CheX, partial [Spirochaetota bacterium]
KEKVSHKMILHIAFFEPINGSLILYFPNECKRQIVENIHGSNWDSLTSDEIDDCLLEVLNVLTGNFLNHYCGKEVRHNMSFPEILFDEKEITEKEEFLDFYYDAEGVIFRAAISISN